MIKQKDFIARYWSNDELARYSKYFSGKVVNVSAWEDLDKQGRRYRDYFPNASEYYLTNYKPGMRGISGLENELFLDLEKELPKDLKGAFDVVYNHTTLEHIYHFQHALNLLADMTKDILILVVPILQQVHVAPDELSSYDSEYGDYWRFTPQAVERLLKERNMEICYLSFNKHRKSWVYCFCISTKHPEKWSGVFPMTYSHIDNCARYYSKHPYAGCNAFRNPYFVEILIVFIKKAFRLAVKTHKKILEILIKAIT